MNTKPRGPFAGPPRVQSVAHPSGGSLIQSDRPYEPSWAMSGRLRTTWADRLGGTYGLCGALHGTLPAGRGVREAIAKATEAKP